MSVVDPRRVKELFLEVVDLPDEASRRARLDAVDPELKARVLALLEGHATPASAVEKPFVVPEITGAYTPAPPSVKIDLSGTIVAGKYKLLQKIGEGGMGDVYMADQTHPVKRRVAVKVIKAGMDSGRVLARFEAERQALALMDHPNIARVLDAGMTGDRNQESGIRGQESNPTPDSRFPTPGSPFFVMELVKGIPLTQFCDEHKLPINDRLNLFIQICSAVQHAHQKGIIHRDLKPTNILVESHDGKPVPKVIDFGLAKATCGIALTEHSLFTAFGTVAGTPLYMAPEQANFNAIDVDTRSDVYALGVILYELLTGTTPIERETLKKKALDEVMRLVRDDEPPTPSSRLSHSQSTASAAATRGMEPLKLGRFVKGELDWIVMKALSKERERRYETANGFARDVERFLNHEPVVAGPPSQAYKLRKFAQRNRVQVIAGSLLVFALLAGIAGTTIGLFEAKKQERLAVAAQLAEAERAEGERLAKLEAQANEKLAGERLVQVEAERKKAEIAKAEAQAKETEANAIVAFFEEKVFSAARPKGQNGGLGKDVSLRDAIVASLPALGQGFAAQPLVEARLRIVLGNTFRFLGEYEQACAQDERARALCKRHLGPEHQVTLLSMNNLAISYAALNRPADALKLYESVRVIQDRILPENHQAILANRSRIATCYANLHRPAEALTLRQEILAIQKRVLPKDHPDTLVTMQNLANSYAAMKRHGDALKLREETVAIQKRVLPKDHPSTLLSMLTLANSYSDTNRHFDALKLHEDVLAIQMRVLPKEHPDILSTMHNLAKSYSLLNRHAEALKLNEELLEILKRVLAKDHPSTLTSMNNLAHSYSTLNRTAEALKLREELLEIQKRVLPKDHDETLRTMIHLSHNYAYLGRHVDALKLREEVLEIQKRVLPEDDPSTLIAKVNVAFSLMILDRGAEAVPLLDEYLAKAQPRRNAAIFQAALTCRVKHYQKAGDPAGCRATAEMWEKLNRKDAVSLYNAACFRAMTVGVQAKTPEADAHKLAKDDADRAMQWLHKAVQAGYKDAIHMKKDTDLDPLRGREDFQMLLAELELKTGTEELPVPKPKTP